MSPSNRNSGGIAKPNFLNEIKLDFGGNEQRDQENFLLHKASFSKKSDDGSEVVVVKSSGRKKSADSKKSKMKYLYIQMECCEQKTLKELIHSGILSRNITLFRSLLTQILEALTYIHSKNLIHRDMKP